MSKKRALELISLGDRLFSKKAQLDNLCQEIAWQFCPDLADFVSPLVLGEDWASDRMDSFPELISRELSSQIGGMLRPQDRPWFKTTTLDEDMDADEENARALQYVSSVIKRGLYNPKSKFIRATKETDRFYVNFGQGVLSIEEAPGTRDHLFFRNHHLKNCAWLENDLGDVDHMHRKDKMTARAMLKRFPANKLHQSIKEAAEKEPAREFQLRVITIPAEEYDSVKMYAGEQDDGGRKRKLPFITVYVDVENQAVIREDGNPEFIYVVPRWHRFADSQYAFSPAAMSGLPDARMAQMLSQIILEAGEKAVDPPMIGKQEVVIGEPNIQAGAISWVDMEHDSKLTDALDVISIQADLRVGFEMRKDIREMLTKAFFIDKLSLPPSEREMTAYEVSQRLEEHIRNIIPFFEPLQIEYNTRVLDLSFALLHNMRQFDWSRIPKAMNGADFTWAFESPVQRAQDAVMVEQFKGSLEVMMLGMQAGATARPLHIDKAMRDAVRGVGGPAIWRKTVEEQEAEAQKIAEEQEQAKAMAQAQQLAAVASQAGDAANKLGMQAPADKLVAAKAKGAAASGQGEGQAEDQGAPGSGQDVMAAIKSQMSGGGGEEGMWSLLGDEAEGEPTEGEEEMPEGGSNVPVPLQRQQTAPAMQGGNEMMQMQRMILRQLSAIEDALSKPKTIKVRRDKSGRIESASAE